MVVAGKPRDKIKAMILSLPLMGGGFNELLVEGEGFTQEWEKDLRIALRNFDLGLEPLTFVLADGKKVTISMKQDVAIVPTNQVGEIEPLDEED